MRELADEFALALPELRNYKQQCEMLGLDYEHRKAILAAATFHLKCVAVMQSERHRRDGAVNRLLMAHKSLNQAVLALKEAGREHRTLMSRLSPLLTKADAIVQSAMTLRRLQDETDGHEPIPFDVR